MRDGADQSGGSGIGAPVDGIDGKTVAVAYHRDGAGVVADRVVADGDTEVGTIVGRQEEWGLGDVGVGHVPAENIGGHHPFVGRRIHVFDEVDNGHSPLAEAGQDEGTTVIVVGEVVGEGSLHIAQSQGDALRDEAVGSEGLEGALAVVGGEVVEAAAEKGVDTDHLTIEESADAVVVGVGKVAGDTCGTRVVACLGRDNIENVDGGVAVVDIPLCGVGINGCIRNHLGELCVAVGSA